MRHALTLDDAQTRAAERLHALAGALKRYRPGKSLFFKSEPPRGLYIWGDVGRGKSMLMDSFFAKAPTSRKRRVHFNAFMVETHARIHELRQNGTGEEIAAVARMVADDATLLCFDEFQVSDVADAMILGRLFQHLFDLGVVVVATSNTAPKHLYEGGLNRQLFLPFIALIEEKLSIVEVNGPKDYRQQAMAGLDVYITPLGADADAKMDAAWQRLAGAEGEAAELDVLGRKLAVPRAANGAARFSFADLCAQPLAAADYLAIARSCRTVFIDGIPVLTAEKRNEARRFIVLIDTLYDTGTRLVCSAAAPPQALYRSGDGADAFRRTASRLTEMRSAEYLDRGDPAL